VECRPVRRFLIDLPETVLFFYDPDVAGAFIERDILDLLPD